MLPFYEHLDTIPPRTSIGLYQNDQGAIVGAAPAPCSNPSKDTSTFELSANEEPRELFCRLLKWKHSVSNFAGAIERWSTESVQKWLALSEHLSEPLVQANLSSFQSLLSNLDGLALSQLSESTLMKPPFNVSSPARLSLLAAIGLQKTRFDSFRVNPAQSVNGKTYTNSDLDSGLKLFQARAKDGAGNLGPISEYIWFVGESYQLVIPQLQRLNV